MTTIKVSSVSEYIKELENLGIENYIFRGQNEPYFGIKANGFRPYMGGWTSDKIYNIDEISKNYYNFLESIYSNGDIRKQLIYQIMEMFESNRLSEKEIIDCLTQMIECYKANNFNYWGESLTEDYEEDGNIEDLFSIQEKLQEDNLEETLHDLYDYVFHEMEDETIPYESDIFEGYPYDGSVYQISAAIYVLLFANLIRIFYEVMDVSERLILKSNIYFTYQPANLFDRINSQKGLFIYQPYLYSHDDMYNYNVLSTQEIIPDILIEVDNYNEILAELDSLGINLDTVYGDLDNIAKSVVYSYRRKNGF